MSQDLRQATWATATMVGLFGMGKYLYSFGTIPNELAGGSSIGTLLRDGGVREEVNKILAEARKEIEDLLREKSTIVEGVRDALLEREEIIARGDRQALRQARGPRRAPGLGGRLRLRLAGRGIRDGRRFHVVVDARRREEPAAPALVDRDASLGR